MERQQTTLAQRFGWKISPPAKLVNALSQIECTDTAICPYPSAYNFPWFDAANQRETMDYLFAMQLASGQHLYHQIAHYKQQVIKLVTKDMGDRVRAIIAHQFGYIGPHYYQPDAHQVPDKAAFMTCNVSPRWTYKRIEDFQLMIPPGALAAQAVLAQYGIYPQAYWVAEQRVDPILTAQFGRWFVAIYAWE